ncbi:MAG TPA: hypothetical protein VMF69_11110 [Gemmataceae bacterium]|nr:hypothetical protein [Gemmataceae bacterium]
MSEPTHNDELAAFQAALARLTPTPDGVPIARLLFRAGQLSARRRSWAWPCATAASMMLAAALMFRPVPQPAERIVTVYVPAAPLPTPQPEPAIPPIVETPAPPDQPASGDGSYLRIRREVLANGLDALPPPQPWSAAAPADDTDTLFDLPRGSREPWLLRLKHSLQSGGSS